VYGRTLLLEDVVKCVGASFEQLDRVADARYTMNGMAPWSQTAYAIELRTQPLF
jgi:hypothetical protein